MPQVLYTDPDGATHALVGEDGTTLMDLVVKNGLPGIVAECGGVLNCASCHVYVDEEWTARVGPAGEDESEMLDGALAERRPGSRLACQVVLKPELAGLHVTVAEEQL